MGMADGSLSITKNKEKEKKLEMIDDAAFLFNLETKDQAKDYKYFFRGIYDNKPKFKPDGIVETKVGHKLSKYDTMLK